MHTSLQFFYKLCRNSGLKGFESFSYYIFIKTSIVIYFRLMLAWDDDEFFVEGNLRSLTDFYGDL